jgi:hypothetical protein
MPDLARPKTELRADLVSCRYRRLINSELNVYKESEISLFLFFILESLLSTLYAKVFFSDFSHSSSFSSILP